MTEYQNFEDLYKIEAGRRATAEKRIEELEAERDKLKRQYVDAVNDYEKKRFEWGQLLIWSQAQEQRIEKLEHAQVYGPFSCL